MTTTYAFDKVRQLSALPNMEEFRFLGVRHDDTVVECHVVKNLDSHCYEIHGDNSPVEFKELKGWMYKRRL